MRNSNPLQTNHITGDILQAIKANDEDVFAMLYKKNYTKVASHILKNNGTIDQAKDVFQEALIAVWHNVRADKFVSESPSAIHGYLFTIAKNKWTDYLRSQRYKKTIISDDVMTNVKDDDVYETSESNVFEQRLEIAKKAFVHLGKECQSLLERFYYEKKSMQMIAQELALDPASARNKKYRCMQKLRELVNTPKLPK